MAESVGTYATVEVRGPWFSASTRPVTTSLPTLPLPADRLKAMAQLRSYDVCVYWLVDVDRLIPDDLLAIASELPGVVVVPDATPTVLHGLTSARGSWSALRRSIAIALGVVVHSPEALAIVDPMTSGSVLLLDTPDRFWQHCFTAAQRQPLLDVAAALGSTLWRLGLETVPGANAAVVDAYMDLFGGTRPVGADANPNDATLLHGNQAQ